MKIVYHPIFQESYPTASCECPARLSSIQSVLSTHDHDHDHDHDYYDYVVPQALSEEELRKVHSQDHIESVKNRNPQAFTSACYAAGGAVLSAEMSLSEPSFALIRPPGHHASADSAWGFCFFNNMALALTMLKEKKTISRALIMDIDLHFGDGTVNILGDEKWVEILNVGTDKRSLFIKIIKKKLETADYDMVGVSAGFDTYEKDWGGILTTDDYHTIGRLVKANAEKRFALLEGGYFLPDLGKNVQAFLEGFR
jgi:acetoin utilization deacetylase AcuC-like enzyme